MLLLPGAEEQTGKDVRGYVSTAIKMTVESERWVRGRVHVGQGLHRPLASLSIPLGREIPDWEKQRCAGE